VSRPIVPGRGANGFTLIEILLVLTLGSLVVLLAHRVFTGVADGAARLTEARMTLDREANARRWLTEAFGSLDVGGSGGAFAGHADRVEFGSWQWVAQGWLTRRRILLQRRGDRVVAAPGPSDSIALADGVTDLQLDYLLEPGDGTGDDAEGMPGASARFVREWMSPVSAPVAVRIRIARATGMVDTLLLIVGPRG
jgi:prepilin-type N-terminal cleavage/methylation domain-containing protein